MESGLDQLSIAPRSAGPPALEKKARRESVPDNRNNDSSNLLGVGTGVTDEQATFQVTSRVGKPNTGGDWVELDRPQKFPRREVIHWLFLSRCHSMHRDCPLLSVAEPPPPHRRRGGGVAWGSAAGREVIVSGNYDSTARVWRSAGIDVITLDVLAKVQSLGMRHRICAPLQGPHFAYSQYQHDASGRSAKTRMSGCHRPGTCGLLELGCCCRRGRSR